MALENDGRRARRDGRILLQHTHRSHSHGTHTLQCKRRGNLSEPIYRPHRRRGPTRQTPPLGLLVLVGYLLDSRFCSVSNDATILTTRFSAPLLYLSRLVAATLSCLVCACTCLSQPVYCTPRVPHRQQLMMTLVAPPRIHRRQRLFVPFWFGDDPDPDAALL